MTKKEKDFIAAMTRMRGMDWVRLGMMIQVAGEMGTIVGYNSGGNLDVVFSNQLKRGKHAYNCHPTWETVYYDADGNIIKDYREKSKAV